MMTYKKRLAALIFLGIFSSAQWAFASPSVADLRFHSGHDHDRVVLDLSEASDYELDTSSDGRTVTLVLKGAAAKKGLSQESFRSKRIESVRWVKGNGEFSVVVRLAQGYKARAGALASPARVYLDVLDPAEAQKTGGKTAASGSKTAGTAGGSTTGASATSKPAAGNAADGEAAALAAAQRLGLPEGAEAVELAPGLMRFDYHVWDGDGWLTAYFLDVDPKMYRLKAALGQGKIPGLQTTGGISDRVNAVAAINASFFNWNGDLIGVTKIDGSVVGTTYIPRSAIGIRADGTPVFGTITYEGEVTIHGVTVPVGGVDAERGADSLVLYNKYYGAHTDTNEYGRELTVVGGKVTAIGTGNSAIPANGWVVSLHGAAADKFAGVQVGDTVSIVQDLGSPWNDVPQVVSVGPCLLKNGSVYVTTAAEQLGDIDRHREPRSAIAYTTRGTYLLAVADGRQASSHGATLTAWARLLKAFGAQDALNLDGGGSSELVAGGEVLNSPSDGRERGVGSAIVVLKK